MSRSPVDITLEPHEELAPAAVIYFASRCTLIDARLALSLSLF